MKTRDALALELLIEPSRIDADVFARLWTRLADPAVGIATYDIKQPTKRPFTPDSDTVLELFRFRLLLALPGWGVPATLGGSRRVGLQLWFARRCVEEPLRQWAIN